MTIPDGIWTRLSCPQCAGSIERTGGSFSCRICNITFPELANGGVDLRIQHTRKTSISVNIDPRSNYPQPSFDRLQMTKPVNSEERSVKLPPRMYKELVSQFPKSSKTSAMMLDLGCGKMPHREVCEHQGYQYVGLDYDETGAMFLGDAQSLPFKDSSFEFVLTIAVLQEVPHPELMIREAHRVLTPGGILIGTAAYLESYRKTYHHFTHLGLNALLHESGFVVDAVAPNHRWTIPISLLGNALFPFMPSLLAVALVSPLYVCHRLWWWLGSLLHPQASESNRLLLTTGSFFFVARKSLT